MLSITGGMQPDANSAAGLVHVESEGPYRLRDWFGSIRNDPHDHAVGASMIVGRNLTTSTLALNV